MKKKSRRLVGWLAIGATVAVILAVATNTRGQEEHEGQTPAGSVHTFSDARQQTKEFHAYNRSITLTGEQQAVMEEALTGLKAPCCADKTALTCCCECNMAKSWWGLSKHLIADQGLNAEQVQTAVSEWLEFINPDGFSGNACYTGGCGRPFRQNGCGGMNENSVIF